MQVEYNLHASIIKSVIDKGIYLIIFSKFFFIISDSPQQTELIDFSLIRLYNSSALAHDTNSVPVCLNLRTVRKEKKVLIFQMAHKVHCKLLIGDCSIKFM